MKIICDTHVLLFWADAPHKLSAAAREAFEAGMAEGTLACADITLWEIGMLLARGRLVLPPGGASIRSYVDDILLAAGVEVLAITPEIAELAQDSAFVHGDPADRLIAATAIAYGGTLISADEKLQSLGRITVVW